jgi:hypothetical protein
MTWRDKLEIGLKENTPCSRVKRNQVPPAAKAGRAPKTSRRSGHPARAAVRKG